MGRRRQDDGVVGDVLELLWDVSKQSPLAGLFIAAGFAAGATYLTWINPKAWFGLGSVFGMLFIVLAASFGAVGAVGLIRASMASRERAHRLDNTFTLDHLRSMSWQQFEQLVADTFRRRGYRVQEVGQVGDGGVDLLLIGRDGQEHLVQCKQYRTSSVGEPKVREFYGAMAAHRTRCEGIIVTCGRFTDPAKQFAADKPLRLIEGQELLELIHSTNSIAPTVRAYSAVAAPELGTSMTPACPKCRSPMVKRVATKGPQAGEAFWGCGTFPKCRGTRPA